MDLPEVALTGSDVIGPEVCSAHARNCIPRFFLTIVVQNVPLRMPDMTTGSYRKSHDPEGGSLTGSCTISVLLGPFHRK